MKEKIIAKAGEMFLKLGFKSITMDDIAGEMCISKKTIYKYFCNKEILIDESVRLLHKEIHLLIDNAISKNYNAIEENFEIRRMFAELFKSSDTSPIYQLKKQYPEIYEKLIEQEINECNCLMSHFIQYEILSILIFPKSRFYNSTSLCTTIRTILPASQHVPISLVVIQEHTIRIGYCFGYLYRVRCVARRVTT